MPYALSTDGTSIHYEHLSDHGPLLILVGGGLDDGAESTPLGQWLGEQFTVVNYQRRGRGRSGDTPPYSVNKEIEDLAAVIDSTGMQAHLFGASSGGALALHASAAGLPIGRIASHELPYLVSDDMVAAWTSYTEALAAALNKDDHAEALRLFMRLAGSSEEDILGAEAAPVWRSLLELAPTLAYDAACLGAGPPPADMLAAVNQPVLLTTGASIDPHSAGLPIDFFGASADATAAALPDGRRSTVEIIGHIAEPSALGPILLDFYQGR